jgi:hypothetical protein
MEMPALQFAQRPFKKSQLKIGMFCQGKILCLQEGQCEAGRKMDISRGILYISTLKKLPKQVPKIGNKSHKKIEGISTNGNIVINP